MSQTYGNTTPLVFNSHAYLASKLTGSDIMSWANSPLPSLCALGANISTNMKHLLTTLYSRLTHVLQSCSTWMFPSSASVENEKWAEFVKDLSAYRAYKTDKRPIDVDADTIVRAIQKEARKYEGPVSYTILKPRTALEQILGRPAPVLWLFGDMHVTRNMCEQCDENDAKEPCLTFYSTLPFNGTKRGTFAYHLESIAKKLQIVTDYHMESWTEAMQETYNFELNISYKFANPDPRYHPSSLSDNYMDMFPCIPKYKHKSCHVPKLRVHVADSRQKVVDFNMLLDLKQYNTFELWKRACNTIVNKQISDELAQKIRQRECLYLISKRILLGPCEFAKQFACSNPILAKHCKTSFELLQLPPVLQVSMCSYLSLMSTKIPFDRAVKDFNFFAFGMKNEDLYAAIKKWYDNCMTLLEEQNVYHNLCFIYGATGTMDLYWLARVLKSPLGGLPSQLSCIYVGDMHVASYIRFLTACMPYYDIVQLVVQRGTNDSKCIIVPEYESHQVKLENIIRFAQAIARSTKSSELVNPFALMSEVCEYTQTSTTLQGEDLVSFEHFIQLHLTWRDFFYDFDVPSRTLKEDQKILPLIKYATPEILNIPFLMLELVKRDACVTELKTHNRIFDDEDCKRALIEVMNTHEDYRIRHNINEVITLCFIPKSPIMSLQAPMSSSVNETGKLSYKRKGKKAFVPYTSRRASSS